MDSNQRNFLLKNDAFTHIHIIYEAYTTYIFVYNHKVDFIMNTEKECEVNS